MKKKSPSIGPHEGIELELMLKKEKDVAFFELEPVHFEPYISDGVLCLRVDQFDTRSTHQDGIKFTSYIVYRPDQAEKAAYLLDLIKQGVDQTFDPDRERAIGRTLGYTEQDIEFYLAHRARLKNAGRI